MRAVHAALPCTAPQSAQSPNGAGTPRAAPCCTCRIMLSAMATVACVAAASDERGSGPDACAPACMHAWECCAARLCRPDARRLRLVELLLLPAADAACAPVRPADGAAGRCFGGQMRTAVRGCFASAVATRPHVAPADRMQVQGLHGGAMPPQPACATSRGTLAAQSYLCGSVTTGQMRCKAALCQLMQRVLQPVAACSTSR